MRHYKGARSVATVRRMGPGGQPVPVARARWRRRLAFSLAARLFASIRFLGRFIDNSVCRRRGGGAISPPGAPLSSRRARPISPRHLANDAVDLAFGHGIELGDLADRHSVTRQSANPAVLGLRYLGALLLARKRRRLGGRFGFAGRTGR